jgi:lipopolysaccharide cholinephosphotransferase
MIKIDHMWEKDMDNIKPLQQKELEILTVFANICDEHQLTYFLSDGTLLGAIRHGGFIPWDDDVDVSMPRSDYNRFLEIAKTALPNHYFIQNYHTESGMPMVFTKLRDSHTLIEEPYFCDLAVNQGIFIDIFPMDHCPDDERKFKNWMRKLNAVYFLLVSDIKSEHKKRNLLKKLVTPLRLIIGRERLLALYDRLLQTFNDEETTKMSQLTVPNFGLRVVFPKECIFPTKKAKFEDQTFMVPHNPDTMLSILYGDYMKLPPVDQQKPHHHVTYQVDIPQKE